MPVIEIIIKHKMYALLWKGDPSELNDFPQSANHTIEADGTLIIWQASRPIVRARPGKDYLILGATDEFFTVPVEQFAQDYAAA